MLHLCHSPLHLQTMWHAESVPVRSMQTACLCEACSAGAFAYRAHTIWGCGRFFVKHGRVCLGAMFSGYGGLELFCIG